MNVAHDISPPDSGPAAPPGSTAVPGESAAFAAGPRIRILLCFGWLYHLRVALLTAIFVAGFPFLLHSGLRSLVEGVFELTAWQMCLVSFMLFLTVWSIRVAANTVLANGRTQFGWELQWSLFQSYPKKEPWKKVLSTWGPLAAYTVLGLPMVVAAIRVSTANGTAGTAALVVAALGGWALSIAVFVVCALAQNLFTDRPDENAIFRPPWLGAWLERWYGKVRPELLPGGLRQKAKTMMSGLLKGEGLCLCLATATVLVFLLGARHVEQPATPLFYLLLAAALLLWILAGAACRLDKYHVPLILPVGVLALYSAIWAETDYYFADRAWAGPPPPPAEHVLAFKPRPILVAVDGGGIQAAAWGTHVLCMLEEMARRDPELGPDFRGFGESIRCVSGVSGGSVGLMYWAAAYDKNGRLPDMESLAGSVCRRAMRTSLPAAVHGLVTNDLWRIAIPMEHDRGEALEQAWSEDTTLRSTFLSDWAADAAAGTRPAILFNATGSESGRPVVFATSSFRTRTNSPPWEFGAVEAPARQAEPQARVFARETSIVTAARMSATFPYVSPSARPGDGTSPGEHLTDGGYYDNSGVCTLSAWMDHGLRQQADAASASQKIGEILVIKIRGSSLGEEKSAGTSRGWFYELTSPLSTLLNVRTAAQQLRGDQEYDLMTNYWDSYGVPIHTAVFTFPHSDVPLSWHLTRLQQEAIRSKHFEAVPDLAASWKVVRDFLLDGKKGVLRSIEGRERPASAVEQAALPREPAKRSAPPPEAREMAPKEAPQMAVPSGEDRSSKAPWPQRR